MRTTEKLRSAIRALAAPSAGLLSMLTAVGMAGALITGGAANGLLTGTVGVATTPGNVPEAWQLANPVIIMEREAIGLAGHLAGAMANAVDHGRLLANPVIVMDRQ